MRLTVERSYLANALGVAGRAVSHRNTLPILSNVLLETEDDRVKLTATDLDTAIRCTIPAQVAENGAVAIPAGVLTDVVSKLPDAPVTLEMQDGKVTVRCGKSDYMILSLPAEDFPTVPTVDGANANTTSFELPQGTLKAMLHQTTFAASKEETRSVLMGVLFEARGATLTMVATDTHRLVWKRTALAVEMPAPQSVIVPGKPLGELGRLLKDKDDAVVTVRCNGSQVQFEAANVVLVSRILDGQYPNYEKVIPKEFKHTITFDRVAMLEAVRRAYIVAQKNSEKLIVTVKGDVMELTAQSQDVGSAYEEVPATTTGGDIQIAFNARYMMEVLGIVTHEKMQLDLAGALNPGALKVADGDGDWLAVIMPMQV